LENAVVRRVKTTNAHPHREILALNIKVQGSLSRLPGVVNRAGGLLLMEAGRPRPAGRAGRPASIILRTDWLFHHFFAFAASSFR
jgi:hypothetical protein